MNRVRGLWVTLCVAALLWSACGTAPAPASKEGIDPETSTGFAAREPVRSQKFMVAAANPLATQAGQAMLAEGGSAVDATIAMALVLTLVEPQSSGIGGGAFMLHRDGAEGGIQAYDGRETAPAGATPDMFAQYAGGGFEGFMQAVVGGKSVGVPGLLRMLEDAHRDHGKLPWAKLFEPAIKLAQDGFEISPRMHMLVSRDPVLAELPATRAYFFDEQGAPRAVGSLLKNPELAEVYQAVAEQGAKAFYTGPIAESIVEAVQKAPRNPGTLSMEDMAAYKAVVRDPVCAPYRDYRVCGMPPPTSGGVTPLQILGVLAQFDLPGMDPDSPEVTHLFAEASRLAYADRGRYLADPDFVEVPVQQLLDPDYLKSRAALISLDKTMGEASPGKPGQGAWLQWGPDRSPELPSTSHMVAVDADGNAVTMTASIETAFGSHLMVRGFLLNNELTDFSFLPEVDGQPVANRIEPGKRPRSSMAPLFVLDGDTGALRMAVGSPGGSRIILYVTRTVIATLDHGLDVQAAISRPNVINRNGATELEQVPGGEGWLEKVKAGLEQRGHEVVVRDLNSGIQGIVVAPDGSYIGGADPRREGLVLGEPDGWSPPAAPAPAEGAATEAPAEDAASE